MKAMAMVMAATVMFFAAGCRVDAGISCGGCGSDYYSGSSRMAPLSYAPSNYTGPAASSTSTSSVADSGKASIRDSGNSRVTVNVRVDGRASVESWRADEYDDRSGDCSEATGINELRQRREQVAKKVAETTAESRRVRAEIGNRRVSDPQLDALEARQKQTGQRLDALSQELQGLNEAIRGR